MRLSYVPSDNNIMGGMHLAVHLPALVGQYLETANPLYCVNIMGVEVAMYEGKTH